MSELTGKTSCDLSNISQPVLKLLLKFIFDKQVKTSNSANQIIKSKYANPHQKFMINFFALLIPVKRH